MTSKHEDIEALYKREEETWTSRYEKVSAAKSEQTDAFLALKNQVKEEREPRFRRDSLLRRKDIINFVGEIQSKFLFQRRNY